MDNSCRDGVEMSSRDEPRGLCESDVSVAMDFFISSLDVSSSLRTAIAVANMAWGVESSLVVVLDVSTGLCGDAMVMRRVYGGPASSSVWGTVAL